MKTYLEAAATISPCGLYRYDLRRQWDAEKTAVLFLMLNPSTADGSQDDPTIRRCVGFARKWGYGGIVVCNLFAIRATDPREVYKADDPVGTENDGYIRKWAERCPLRIAAWGVHGFHRERHWLVQDMFGPGAMNLRLCHLGLTKFGCPRHPLYLAGRTRPIEWDTQAAESSCRECGCTEEDCRGCIERTGVPCHWVEADLCSACVKPTAKRKRAGKAS